MAPQPLVGGVVSPPLAFLIDYLVWKFEFRIFADLRALPLRGRSSLIRVGDGGAPPQELQAFPEVLVVFDVID
jgi:hypothetical protein